MNLCACAVSTTFHLTRLLTAQSAPPAEAAMRRMSFSGRNGEVQAPDH